MTDTVKDTPTTLLTSAMLFLDKLSKNVPHEHGSSPGSCTGCEQHHQVLALQERVSKLKKRTPAVDTTKARKPRTKAVAEQKNVQPNLDMPAKNEDAIPAPKPEPVAVAAPRHVRGPFDGPDGGYPRQ